MDDFDIFINKLFKRHLQKKPYKKCFINNCNNIGSYNFFNKLTNHCCKNHKLPNMLKIVGPVLLVKNYILFIFNYIFIDN